MPGTGFEPVCLAAARFKFDQAVSGGVHQVPFQARWLSERTARIDPNGLELQPRLQPPTSSMPWAGVWLLPAAGEARFACDQAILPLPVVATWCVPVTARSPRWSPRRTPRTTRCGWFMAVVACGRLPNLSHRRRRSGGLPALRLSMLTEARARVHTGGRAGPRYEYGLDQSVTGRGYPPPSVDTYVPTVFEHLFYTASHGHEPPLLSGATSQPRNSALLGLADGHRAGIIARSDTGVVAVQLRYLDSPSRLRSRSPLRTLDRRLVHRRSPTAHRELAYGGDPERGSSSQA
ncbi:hypothetical protein FB561_7370 [Kribbella amoyensis]|uniref:Uncharacterized protein n=1 Tax=Kribbella amoyensis TaxID=996641 RepID=A0A561B3Q6_9ACTN|nr:hypothetical protein FB561_7370 [Kribbella amoyensis]